MNYKINFNGTDFFVKKGEFVVVCGKSGSGKTTFLLQLENELKKLGQKTGFVFQNFDSQIVTDKVWHELSFALENTAVPRKIMERRVAEMAAYFGISDWLCSKTENLSGGQKQLLNLASTMALNPDFLLLDEPTSQLDPIVASNFLSTVKKINSEFGTTVVICEHRLEELFEKAGRILFLDKMRIFFDEKPQNFCQKILACQKKDLIEFLPTASKIISRFEKKPEKLPLSVAQGRSWILEFLEKGGKLEPENLSLLEGDENLKNEKNHQFDEKNCPQKSKNLVKIKNLSFRYEKTLPWILQELDFCIEEGKIYAIAGANGSGKSTLLKILCSLLKNFRGTVKIEKTARNKIFMLPQNVRNVFTKQTVLEELEECGWKKDENSALNENVFLSAEKELKKNASLTEDSILQNAIFSLKENFLHHPYDLSGGEMQKLALAKILLQKPKILLLDEPTKGLDNAFKKEFSLLLKNLARSGISIVLVCHDLEFCAYTADFTGLMFEGRVCGLEKTSDFFEKNIFYTTARNRLLRGFENSTGKNPETEAEK